MFNYNVNHACTCTCSVLALSPRPSPHTHPHTHIPTHTTHSGSDGLVKVWTIRTNECAATMDGHTERVWALAVGEDGGEVVSGGGDSLVCTWKVSNYIVTVSR